MATASMLPCGYKAWPNPAVPIGLGVRCYRQLAGDTSLGEQHMIFQLAEGAVPRGLFDEILQRIDRLRPQPPPPAA
jgi:hypothetical protein